MQVIGVNQPFLRLSSRGFGAIAAILFSFATIDSQAVEFGVFAGGAYGNLNTLRRGGLAGPAGSAGLQLQLSDFWGIALDGGASYHFENKKDELAAESVVGSSFQVRYYADVFEYVPYFGIGPTFFIRAPSVDDATPTQFGGKFTFGIDRRFHRFWSVGFQGDLFALANDLSRYPIYSTVGLRVVRHFRF